MPFLERWPWLLLFQQPIPKCISNLIQMRLHTDYFAWLIAYMVCGYFTYSVFLIYIILPWAKNLLRHTAITYNNIVL